MSLEEAQQLESEWVMQTFKRSEVEFVRGEGTKVWDAEGNEYLDLLTGISVNSIGHCHPAVVEAIREQSRTLMHVSNLYYSRPVLDLAKRLCESSLGGRAFICNSGAEANETAIKLVRKHAHGRGVDNPEIVVLEDAFHGRTMGTVSATPGMSEDEAFAPYLPGFKPVPRDDPEALRDAVGESTAAVMLEPIQGETGVNVISDEMILTARAVTAETHSLLVFDEVQTGMGRTGSLWAYEQLPARPDVMTTAKALGGGFPIGACVSTPELGEVFEPGDHGSTFGGNPPACRAALAAFDVIDDPELLRRVRELGTRLCEELEKMTGVASVRGRGLMIGVELAGGRDEKETAAALLQEGLVVNAPVASTLRLLPPLTISEPELDAALERFGRVLG